MFSKNTFSNWYTI